MTDEREDEELTSQALAWLTRVSLGNATEDDLASLRRWRDETPAHAVALARAGRLWRDLGPPVAALAQSGAGLAPPRRPARRAFLVGGMAAAAGAAAVVAMHPPLGLWPSIAELDADYRTATGEQRHLALSAGLSIEMNTRTSLALRPAAGGGGAVELIAGEAAVSVAEAGPQPFVVLAAGGRTTARRATVNLRREGAAVCVTCIDGEVTVEQGGRVLTVGPARQLSYGAKGLGEVAAADPTVVVAWRDGMLVFHDTALAQVIDEVNRYRPGRIVLVDQVLGRRLVSARFEIARLDRVIWQIQHVFNAPVKTLPGGLVLVG
jgi:transmembrane sensor